MLRRCWPLLVALLTVGWTPCVSAQSVFDQIGLTALRDRLGPGAPTGAGIAVMHAEAIESSPPPAYLPDPANPEFVGKTFNDHSGGGGISGHATGVGAIFYGFFGGVAPDITEIHNYRVQGNLDSGDWFGPAYLNFGAGVPVSAANQRVQNHSWIDTDPFDANSQRASRRYDFALRRDNVIGVVGVNNGSASPIPALLANSYNSIAVGLTNANSSFGPTTGDVVGRSKPDIVGPTGATSFATPLVAGSAALLLNTADAKTDPTERLHAGRMESIKAALLTGATKSEFAGLAQPWTRTNNGSYVEPLDRRFGAGELNINNSHLILSAPEKRGTDTALANGAGWSFDTLTANDAVRHFYLNVVGDPTTSFTATVTWLRRITPTGTGTDVFDTSTATLSDIELRLFEANPDFSLGTLVDSSVSPIDNVQHIFQPGLTSHLYALEVRLAGLPSGQTSEDFAVAWFTTVAPVPEPGTLALCALAAAAVLALRRRRGLRRSSKIAASG